MGMTEVEVLADLVDEVMRQDESHLRLSERLRSSIGLRTYEFDLKPFELDRHTINIPNEIKILFETENSRRGILNAVGLCWCSQGSFIYLWDFISPADDVYVYDTCLEGDVMHMLCVCPKICVSDCDYIIIATTEYEVSMHSLTLDQTGVIKIERMDNFTVFSARKITSLCGHDASGRIFLGNDVGVVCEFEYWLDEKDSDWFSSDRVYVDLKFCRGVLSSLLDHVTLGISSKLVADPIKQMEIDQSRGILYTLHISNRICVYGVPPMTTLALLSVRQHYSTLTSHALSYRGRNNLEPTLHFICQLTGAVVESQFVEMFRQSELHRGWTCPTNTGHTHTHTHTHTHKHT
eukprot:GHVR01109489.1.p1 GENE.GHVR01109489.1~~GHVR01109489.1.p1  ORF type:complete len:349 (+),score=101.65 GHVR01109489.1:163-1209(+)